MDESKDAPRPVKPSEVDLLGYLPYRNGAPDAVLRAKEFPIEAHCEQGLPLPPKSLWVSPDYGATPEAYLRIGREQIDSMRRALACTGFTMPGCPTILDFGAAAGRMTRWLLPEARSGRVVGVDVNAEAVYWSQQHLQPPFVFLMTTLNPHLPFRDKTFDLIYSGSVFTHIEDLADAWLAELARVLRPGGRAWLTIHDEASVDLLAGAWRDSHFGRTRPPMAAYREFAACDYARFTLGRGILSQVFYRRAWFAKMAEPWFKVLSFDEGAYLYQTAVTLEAR